MADTSNLSKFLSDVADAIRTKKETTNPIAAADFDSEILGIESGSGTGDVKLFETIDEMHASTGNKEGDLAIVYSKKVNNATVDSQFSKATFPATVVLPSAFSGDAYVVYRAVDSSQWFDCWGEMTSTGFSMSCYTESGEIYVSYESTDGITYTRTDGGDETIDFGLDIYYAYTEYWDDAIGYFVQVVNDNLDGLFIYELDSVSEDYYFLPIKDLTMGSDYKFTWNKSYDEDYVFSKEDVDLFFEKVWAYGDSLGMSFNGAKDLAVICDGKLTTFMYTAVYSSTSKYNTISCGAVYDVATARWWIRLGNTVSSTDANSIVKLQMVDGELVVTNMTGVTGVFSDTYAVDIVPDTMQFRAEAQSTSPYVSVNNNGTSVTTYSGNMDYDCKYHFDKYVLAPTQFTLNSASELLPGKVAYGKNGAVTGDGTIYNNLDIDTLNGAYGLNLSETYISDYTGNGKNAVSYTPNTQGDKIVNVLRMRVPERQIKQNCNLRLDDNNILSCNLISGTKTLEVYKTDINTAEQTVIGTLDLTEHYVGSNTSLPAHYATWDYDETNKIAYCCIIDRSSTASNYIIFKVDMNTNSVTYINKFNKKYNGLFAISAKNQAVYLCMNTEGLTKTTFSGTQTTIKSGLSLQGDAMAQYRFIPCYTGTTYYIYDVERETFIYESTTNIAGGGIAIAGTKAYCVDYNSTSTVHIYDIENATFLDETADLGSGNNERSFCSYTHRGAIIKNNKAIFSANWAEWLVDVSTDTVEFFSRFVMGICVAVEGKDVVALGLNGLCKKMHITIDENDGGQCLAFKTSTGENYYLRQSDVDRIANFGSIYGETVTPEQYTEAQEQISDLFGEEVVE